MRLILIFFVYFIINLFSIPAFAEKKAIKLNNAAEFNSAPSIFNKDDFSTFMAKKDIAPKKTAPRLQTPSQISPSGPDNSNPSQPKFIPLTNGAPYQATSLTKEDQSSKEDKDKTNNRNTNGVLLNSQSNNNVDSSSWIIT